MLDYFDRHVIHTIAIHRCLQYQDKINYFIEVFVVKILILDHARIYMQFNLLCVHKDRECYHGLLPSENSPLEGFICGMKLISSEDLL